MERIITKIIRIGKTKEEKFKELDNKNLELDNKMKEIDDKMIDFETRIKLLEDKQ